jgi:hypothetical protein
MVTATFGMRSGKYVTLATPPVRIWDTNIRYVIVYDIDDFMNIGNGKMLPPSSASLGFRPQPCLPKPNGIPDINADLDLILCPRLSSLLQVHVDV